MNTTTRRFAAGIALLLIGLSLTIAVNLTALRIVRADPGVLYAAPTAQGSNNCSSWANACTLQTALAQAVSGDEIWVKAGVHKPGANRTSTFTLKGGVAIYGGFAGTETTRSQRNWQANRTILSGDIDQNDLNTDGNFIAETWGDIQGNNAYTVVTGGGTGQTAVLDGFIITAGQANGDDMYDPEPYWVGGGMYNVNSSPTLTNMVFSGNMAQGPGGAMYNKNSNPTLTNVVFSGNAANAGGGMENDASHPTLINITFSGNSAVYGGGVSNIGNSNPTLTNCILWGNSAGIGGPQIYDDGTGATTVTYSDVQGDYLGTGNINADPLFVDAANGNLRLQANSPAIDAGNNAAVPTGVTTDLDGSPRFVDILSIPNTGSGTPPIVDMGAYEAQVTLDHHLFVPLVLNSMP